MIVTSFFQIYLKPDAHAPGLTAPARSAGILHDKAFGKHTDCLLKWIASAMFFFTSPGLPAQHFKAADSVQAATADSLPPRRSWPANRMLLAAEITPWVVDRYIRQMDYARITWKSTAHNLNPGNWEWDGDGFTTNQFGHPYHGSVFFNAYRSNGYNFWQSSLAVFAGSYLWETFAENQAPAPNDFINTGFGGVVLGELAHRFSRRIVSSRENGFRRQAAEISALLINPVNGFQRISRGAWAKDAARDTTPVETELDVGIRRFRSNKNLHQWAPFARVRFIYGNPFQSSKTPFDHFGIHVEMGKDDSSIINMVNVYGTLRSWRINADNRRVQHGLQLTAHYDYIHNSAFFYSAQSVRAQWQSAFQAGRRVHLQTQSGGGLILLAAVPDPVMYKGRYYDFCMGIGYHTSIIISGGKRVVAGLHYRGGYLRTVNGSAKDYFLHTFSGEVRVALLPGFYLCAEPGHFSLTGRYENLPQMRRTYPYMRYSFRWAFSIR